MKLLLAVAALITLAAAPTPQAADQAAIREFKTILWPRAYAQGDVALLDRLLADDFQSIDGDGVVTDKAGELAWLRTKAPDPTGRSFRYVIERLDFVTPDTAIVSGTGYVGTLRDGKPAAMTYKSSNVLVKRGGLWRAVGSHVSGAKPTTSP